MNQSIPPKHLKILILAAGILGLVLRSALYATGIDDRGLLEPLHPAGLLVLLLSAAAAVALALTTRSLSGPENYRDAFPGSLIAGLGYLPAGVMTVVTAVSERAGQAPCLGMLALVLGIAAGASLLEMGRCRMVGKRPHWLLPTAVCVFFTFRTVCRYRLWSSHPQLMDYCFYLGAHIALMLLSYYHAAFAAGMTKHRPLWITGLAAVYLCLLALPRAEDWPLLVSWGLWAFAGLSCLTPRPRRQMPPMELEDNP